MTQNFTNKEILVFDDCSTDNSINLLKKFKKIKVLKNKKKKFKSGALNQIYGINKLFKKSTGEIIFLLDGDDQFKRDKLNTIYKKFNKDKNLQFIQDRPFLKDINTYMTLKRKNHHFLIWPSFYPTSCISIRRNFFNQFLKIVEKDKFLNLEIDARLAMFAFVKNKFFTLKDNLTIYNQDNEGISSNYNKFSKNWWKKRNEAFTYLIFLKKKLNHKFFLGPDFFITRLINLFFLYKIDI